MKKGISSVVAVVLLIAISVIAAVSIYYWVGGIVSQRSVRKEPMTIEATPVNPAEGKVLVANKGGTPITLFELGTDEEISDKIAKIGEEITFKDKGSSFLEGGITSYEWDFDIHTSFKTDASGKTVTHSYSSHGNYKVGLKVTNSRGVSEIETFNVEVRSSPNADAGPNLTEPVDTPITFDGSGSSDPDGTIESYDWEFGDNSTGTCETISHTYTSASTHTVTLKVTDNNGYTDEDTASVSIGYHPVAEAGPDQSADINEIVQFNGSGSNDPDGTIESYKWKFGDGGTAIGATPSYQYSSKGTYDVELTVTDDNGFHDTDGLTVIIGNAPVAEAGSNQSIKAGETVTLDGSNSYDSNYYRLDQSVNSSTAEFAGVSQKKQTFVPQLEEISRIKVKVASPVNQEVTIQVLDNSGNEVGSGLVEVSNPDYQWISWTFSPSLDVTPGETYKIVLTPSDKGEVVDFPVSGNAWGYSGWGDCSSQTGNWSDIDDFCKCKGYIGAVSKNKNPCYHGLTDYGANEWETDNLSSNCISTGDYHFTADEDLEKVKCIPENSALNPLDVEVDQSNSYSDGQFNDEQDWDMNFKTFCEGSENCPTPGALQFSWEFEDGSSSSGAVVDHTYPNSGSYLPNLTVTDQEYLSDTDNVTITVSLTITVEENQPPEGNFPNQEMEEDTSNSFNLNNSFTDPEGEDLSYAAWDYNDSHVNIQIDAQNQMIIEPGQDWNGQENNIKINVSDPDGNKITDKFNLTVTPVNDAPELDPIADKTAGTEQQFYLNENATDVDNSY